MKVFPFGTSAFLCFYCTDEDVLLHEELTVRVENLASH